MSRSMLARFARLRSRMYERAAEALAGATTPELDAIIARLRDDPAAPRSARIDALYEVLATTPKSVLDQVCDAIVAARGAK